MTLSVVHFVRCTGYKFLFSNTVSCKPWSTLLCNFISFLGNPDIQGANDAEGSSNIFSYTYHGTGPFSEPETKAVKLATDYIIQDHGPDK